MGDRAEVEVRDNDGSVWLYTHWSGTELPQVVATALDRGRDRWDDSGYLARIIFSEMIKDEVMETRGYAINPIGGAGDRVIVVDVPNQIIRGHGEGDGFDEAGGSFEAFVAASKLLPRS